MSTTATAAKTFQELGLSEDTLSSLQGMGYESPTRVQQESIPVALTGKDLVVQSRTGTGKTAAFGIPIVEAIHAEAADVQAMVLTPTRELTAQVCEELSKIGAGRGLKVLAIYGGDPIDKQIQGIKDGAQIIVGTPGRVLDLLKRRELVLTSVRSLVLDEADKMLDMGFAQEMSEIMAFVPKERQSSLFSATVPLGIKGIIHNFLDDPSWISLSDDFAYVKEVRHAYMIAPATHKERVLYQLIELDQPSSSMIFCNTKNEVRSVSTFLSRQGLPVAMISSDLTQKKREQVMAKFRSGEILHLVATDVAARGIDVFDLSHVFIYSTPDSPEDYIHRAGRTGRSGRAGDVVSLVSATDLVNFNRLANRYELQLIERDVPTEDEILQRRNERLIERLVAEARDSASKGRNEMDGLAAVIHAHEDRDTIVSYLAYQRLVQAPKDEAEEEPVEESASSETKSEDGVESVAPKSPRRRRRPRRPRRSS